MAMATFFKWNNNEAILCQHYLYTQGNRNYSDFFFFFFAWKFLLKGPRKKEVKKIFFFKFSLDFFNERIQNVKEKKKKHFEKEEFIWVIFILLLLINSEFHTHTHKTIVALMWFYFFLLLLLSFNVQNLLVFLNFLFKFSSFLPCACLVCVLLSSVLIFFIFLFKFNSSLFFSFLEKKKQNFLASMCFGVSKVCHFFLLFFFFQRLYIIYKTVNQIIVGDDSFFELKVTISKVFVLGIGKYWNFFFLFFSFQIPPMTYTTNTTPNFRPISWNMF